MLQRRDQEFLCTASEVDHFLIVTHEFEHDVAILEYLRISDVDMFIEAIIERMSSIWECQVVIPDPSYVADDWEREKREGGTYGKRSRSISVSITTL